LKHKTISLDNIDAFIFDFDGVMTNNSVYLDEHGKESVRCSRSDGLAFNVINKLKKPTYIVSTEKNQVVKARAKKLQVPILYGLDDKVSAVKNLSISKGYSLKKILYVGNDLNDLLIMKLCGFTACPSDSHEKIKEISSRVLMSKGGEGVIRELLESFLEIDFIKVLYSE
jgi:3-deoxy-D-manno-octulosonate 8-phosphate phosphatase (KDO 8-P phosphatase)